MSLEQFFQHTVVAFVDPWGSLKEAVFDPMVVVDCKIIAVAVVFVVVADGVVKLVTDPHGIGGGDWKGDVAKDPAVSSISWVLHKSEKHTHSFLNRQNTNSFSCRTLSGCPDSRQSSGFGE